MKLFGIWPLVTERIYKLHGAKVIWLARMQRKGLRFKSGDIGSSQVPFWQTQSYNANIGISFAVGAFIFALGSIFMFCSLRWPELVNLTNLTFFAGSIPFTIAAGLQHFQSANASDFSVQEVEGHTRLSIIGWHPSSAGWLSSFTQFIGTLAFNISTFNSIAAPGRPELDVLEIWAPNFEGSVLFLISGYLAFVEVGNKHWSWRPKSLSWQIVFINLLGCVAFMIAAITPSSPNRDDALWLLSYSNTHTLIGAVYFFIGAVLLVRESREAEPS
ncbi:hypothetical protein [Ochrobactrum sp. Marseille-Q0166]|uniref:hypothetical protein n=1 Tax=Ochrobactrum sp. Marseille-Q0166 TaxID=2761105 RepID=UPI0016561200|nr:hypothetical protein [Ochrobactrum sp. Marseille-Q0166]MBC8716488.1 hypothetical protein [Ochrobactrum sp. Marseille-Q0166]